MNTITAIRYLASNRYLACNSCSIDMIDTEFPIDPKIEEKLRETGRLYMGDGFELKRQLPCYFCGNNTNHMIQWTTY